MSAATYSLDFGGLQLSHGLAVTGRVNDIEEYMDDQRGFEHADALAHSGDYFMTLATRLDLISQSLPRDSAEQIEIEHLIDTLFYLQKHYVIVDKSKH